MSQFWRAWLTVWVAGVLAFGGVLMAAAVPALDGIAVWIMTTMNPTTPATFDDPLRFAVALVGAVTFGWGMTLYAVTRAAIALEERGAPIWRILLLTVAVWYAVDSYASVATGFWLNAVSNTVLTIAFLIPIFASGVWRADGAARGAAA